MAHSWLRRGGGHLRHEACAHVWEWPHFPQYYIPIKDIRPDVLVDEDTTQHSPRGSVALQGLRVGETHRLTAPR